MASVFEICAGGGGQAIGLEDAGFECLGAVEIERAACETLRLNRPLWNVIEADVREVNGAPFQGVDLLAGGVPCPPFSIAGKQLGSNDERDLFPEALRLAAEIRPRSIMLENVPGFASEKFRAYRQALFAKFRRLGYVADFRILIASDFGVPQLRPRCVIVAMHEDDARFFRWPDGSREPARTVGETLEDLMASRHWGGVKAWKKKANGIAPTVVGGSKKHGGPDLGPTRARQQWELLGVDGIGIANEPPDPTFPKDAKPKLTVRMVARIQGFPDAWQFSGRKTAAYRQVGNAFPPSVAEAVGRAILRTFQGIYEARRLRELRNEEGWQILSHRDRASLKPGEYILETRKRIPAFPRNISKETRSLVLERNGHTCQMCGATPGDPDPYQPSRSVRLTMGHIVDKDKGGKDEPGNLQAMCANCNEGLQNISPPRPSRVQLLTYVRRATRDDQKAVLDWLLEKFRER